MVLVKRSKWLGIFLPLLIVTAASAAPTVSNYSSNLVVSAVSPASDVHISSVPEVPQIAGPSDSHLARVAAEFLKPPPAFTGSPALPVGAKSLPAVPGALLMGLIGFLCVSLVKDRRFWLAALAGLLWLGQAGIQAVPQLAVRLSHRNHTARPLDTELNYPYYLENSRLRSDIEGAQYIGLLHHLAGIPDSTMSFLLPTSMPSLRAQRSNLKSVSNSQTLAQSKGRFGAPQFAIMGRASHIIPVTNCLALRAEQFIYFSPAFIFDNLARGPPELA
ncbi:MAG TPA: hypothetical protein HPP66_10385 [Planctomycetes bacterium]|nr:hypothetical protein [Planctomycetota bacterium]